MQKGMRKCKVCGEYYEYCKTNRGIGIFRWQDVACCPEHGSIYLARIEASRLGGNAESGPSSNESEYAKIELDDIDFAEYNENDSDEDDFDEDEYEED